MPAEPAVDTDQTSEENQLAVEEPQVEQAVVVSPDWYSYDLTDINTGAVFSIEDYSGKVVLIETMAVWCGNCLKQQLEVAKLH